MKHDLYITLPFTHERDTQPLENDDKFPESLARHFIKKYTKKGNKVFDPFAGLGTSLFVAEELKRVPYGIEADRERYEWTAGQLEHWNNLKHGDSAALKKFDFPKMDFCLTSPPYMHKPLKYNPLFGGDPSKAGYEKYLKRMRQIFAGLKPVMKKNAYIAVHVDNLEHAKGSTPLIFDFAKEISKTFTLENQTSITWTNAKTDYPLTQVLMFKNA